MDLSLPYAMYLLCYDHEKARMGEDNALVRGQLLRAAAAAQLRLWGLLTDRDGKAVRAVDAPTDVRDDFLAEVLAAVPVDAPKRWFGVVDARWHTAEATVRDRLATAGVVRVDRRRWLGVLPYRAATPTDPDHARALRDRVRRTLFEPAGAPIEDAVLMTIAVDGDARTVLRGRERREHRAAVDVLGARVEAALPGLRRALTLSIAARRTGAA